MTINQLFNDTDLALYQQQHKVGSRLHDRLITEIEVRKHLDRHPISGESFSLVLTHLADEPESSAPVEPGAETGKITD